MSSFSPKTARESLPDMLSSKKGESSREKSGEASPISGSEPVEPKPKSQVSRKRPNQAQRRHLNSLLSISLNSEPAQTNQRPTMQNNRGQKKPRRPRPAQNQQQHLESLSRKQHSPKNCNKASSNLSSLKPSHPPFLPRQHVQRWSHQDPTAYPHPPFQQTQQPHFAHDAQVLFEQKLDEARYQGVYLDNLITQVVSRVMIGPKEVMEKDSFRCRVEGHCRMAIMQYQRNFHNVEIHPSKIELRCFGSLMSGLATKASDMDLALITPNVNSSTHAPFWTIPRLLEKTLLNLGFGARLLTKTRVPILKICERPSPKLYHDLMEEHAKWERNNKIEKPDTRSNEEILRSLVQERNQSLIDYYNKAQQILEEIGGRKYDLDFGRRPSKLKMKEKKIFSSVSKAFIIGLSSTALSRSLQRFTSIQPLFDPLSAPTYRSLHILYLQAEGERLASVWDKRQLIEASTQDEALAEQVVQAWWVLQEKHAAVVETLSFYQRLFKTQERLKRIVSLKLVILEQKEREDPVVYLERVKKMVRKLRPRPELTEQDAASVVVSKYISGIRDATVRQILEALEPAGVPLERIARQHRLVQLAVDYELALERGFYAPEDRDFVAQFIGRLKALTLHTPNVPRAGPIIRRLMTLADPTRVSAPHKPGARLGDHLEFPRATAGIRCDINFSAEFALHNTHLLRCYTSSDARVGPIILFVKHWAETRGIKSSYRGTLSSYGYALMVLHYLVNVARPFVCPNLQAIRSDLPDYSQPPGIDTQFCKGKDVRFWRNEDEIKGLAQRNLLNQNYEPMGMLVRGFFEYFAHEGQMSGGQGQGFDWNRDVLSLRTMGGLLKKRDKGWVSATTVKETTAVPAKSNSVASGANIRRSNSKTTGEIREIRNRYLFAIEDPFELDHNVARTVTGQGISSIRSEFRRAWRIIRNHGRHYQDQDGGLIDPVSCKDSPLHDTLRLILNPET